MFNVSWNVHSGVNASILGKIPVRQANAVKAKHHIPTVNANARVMIHQRYDKNRERTEENGI